MNGTEKSGNGRVWAIGAIAAVIAFIVLWIVSGMFFWPRLVLSVLIGVLVAILVWIGYYRDAEAEPDGLGKPLGTGGGAKPDGGAAAAPKARSEPTAPASPSTPEPKAAKAAPSAGKSGAEPKAAKAAPSAATPGAEPKAASPGAATAGEGPQTLTAPRAGGADDLKKISGVGPKLEKTLNELGIYHYDQIAAWTAQDIAWVDERLTFKGRIERDDWVGQAKALASKGGAA